MRSFIKKSVFPHQMVKLDLCHMNCKSDCISKVIPNTSARDWPGRLQPFTWSHGALMVHNSVKLNQGTMKPLQGEAASFDCSC